MVACGLGVLAVGAVRPSACTVAQISSTTELVLAGAGTTVKRFFGTLVDIVLASVTVEASASTVARKSVDLVAAFPTVGARVGVAFIQFGGASGALEAGAITVAVEPAGVVNAGAVCARRGIAFVDIIGASGALEASVIAVARKSVDLVAATPAVGARIGVAFVDVILASGAVEAGVIAVACKSVDLVAATPAVGARVGIALIYFGARDVGAANGFKLTVSASVSDNRILCMRQHECVAYVSN